MISLLLLAATYLARTALAITPETNAGFNIVWQDNFSSTSLDTTKWNLYTGAVSNSEQEVYVSNSTTCNITPQKSFLITPIKNNGKWSSCRIETIQSFQAQPGRQLIVQARLKLGAPGSNLQGVWPAFWSLGQAVRNGVGWPQCGEIDTFENIDGGALGYGTLHCGTACNDPTGLSAGINFDYGSFHTWAHAIDLRPSDWTQQTITFYMDGTPYHVVHGSDVNNQAAWIALAQSPMFMTLNVAIGGDWPGPVSANTVSGASAGMEVLYVAVYQSA